MFEIVCGWVWVGCRCWIILLQFTIPAHTFMRAASASRRECRCTCPAFVCSFVHRLSIYVTEFARTPLSRSSIMVNAFGKTAHATAVSSSTIGNTLNRLSRSVRKWCLRSAPCNLNCVFFCSRPQPLVECDDVFHWRVARQTKWM